MKKNKYKLFSNPIKWYIQNVKDSIEPTNLSHRVRMNIDIPKGATKGRALIPCAIYSFDHSIDLNPALIRRKDKKKISEFPVNKRFSYDSNKYDVQLTKQEKKLGYTLDEIEKCRHCGQRLVIAEVAETRYRSCPDIKVRVADNAKEDLKIPVDFGINKKDVMMGMWSWLFFDSVIVFVGFSAVTGFNLSEYTTPFISAIPNWVKWIVGIPLVAWVLLMLIVMLSRIHYKAYMLWKWWRNIKPTLTKIRVAN